MISKLTNITVQLLVKRLPAQQQLTERLQPIAQRHCNQQRTTISDKQEQQPPTTHCSEIQPTYFDLLWPTAICQLQQQRTSHIQQTSSVYNKRLPAVYLPTYLPPICCFSQAQPTPTNVRQEEM
eukprot:gene10331-2472_t